MASLEGESILSPAPEDGVSSVTFAPTTDVLLAGCWDAKLRLYDASTNTLMHSFAYEAPVLDSCFTDNTHGVGVGLEMCVRLHDFNQPNNSSVLGKHTKGIRCAEFARDLGVVFSGGWDKVVHAWDPRAPSGTPVGTMPLPGKCFSMSLGGGGNGRLVVGTSERRIVCFDPRAMKAYDAADPAGSATAPLFDRPSALDYQTRAVRCSPDGEGFVVGSIEGRVAVDFINPEAGKKYAFKCHRVGNTVFPVNCIAFHPFYGTFATGGCDGFVNIWDGKNRKRLSQMPSFPTSIAALCFNHDGTKLAVAASYTFEEGEKDTPPDQIYIKAIHDSEVKPKVKAKSQGDAAT